MPIIRTEIRREHLDTVRRTVALERLRDKARAEHLKPFVDLSLGIYAPERAFRRRPQSLAPLAAVAFKES